MYFNLFFNADLIISLSFPPTKYPFSTTQFEKCFFPQNSKRLNNNMNGESLQNRAFRGLRVEQRSRCVFVNEKKRERGRKKNYLPCAMSYKPSFFMLAQFKRVKK